MPGHKINERHHMNTKQIVRDMIGQNRSGAYKTKTEAMRDGEVLGLKAWKHEDGSWDLE